jgi:hypothetical protein
MRNNSAMAGPAELVQTLSAVTGLPLSTVVDIDRRLVQAGLRTKHGRGVNAARMTPLDAARLLAAVLASPQGNAAADAVHRYTNTRVDKARSSDDLYGTAKLDDLAKLPARHSFIDALAALITSVSSGSIAELIATSDNGWAPQIEVFAFTRAVRARIRIAGLPNGLTAAVEYVAAAGGDRSGRTRRAGQSRRSQADDIGDLEQSRRITERTILPIAELLVAESRDERA